MAIQKKAPKKSKVSKGTKQKKKKDGRMKKLKKEGSKHGINKASKDPKKSKEKKKVISGHKEGIKKKKKVSKGKKASTTKVQVVPQPADKLQLDATQLSLVSPNTAKKQKQQGVDLLPPTEKPKNEKRSQEISKLYKILDEIPDSKTQPMSTATEGMKKHDSKKEKGEMKKKKGSKKSDEKKDEQKKKKKKKTASKKEEKKDDKKKGSEKNVKEEEKKKKGSDEEGKKKESKKDVKVPIVVPEKAKEDAKKDDKKEDEKKKKEESDKKKKEENKDSKKDEKKKKEESDKKKKEDANDKKEEKKDSKKDEKKKKEESDKKKKEESDKKKKEESDKKKAAKKEEANLGSPDVITPQQVGPPMMEKSLSLENTQSSKSLKDNSAGKRAAIRAPIVPGPPGKTSKPKPESSEFALESPDSEKQKRIKNMRSDMELPFVEPDFVANHGDTHVGMRKVDIDLIGRTGMYMERRGMSSDKKQAFDWIAYNRHDLANKQTDFSKNLAIALADVGVSKRLAMRTLSVLRINGQITGREMIIVQREMSRGPDVVSFSQLIGFLHKHCEQYKSKTPPGTPKMGQTPVKMPRPKTPIPP